MLKKLNKHTKTIKGRTTLLVASFLIILLSFSTYVYFQAREIKRDYHNYKTKWQAVQLQMFIEAWNVTSLKVIFYESLYTHFSDSSNLSINRFREIESVNIYFKNRLDSLNADFNYQEPSLNLQKALDGMYKTCFKLFRRINEFKANNLTNKINTDSIIKNTFRPEFETYTTSFWGDFFSKVINPVNDRAEKLATEIKNRTVR